MNYEKVTLEPFYVIGISIRTNNSGGTLQQDIASLWNRFFSPNIADQIPNKVNHEIYSVYTDYESDYTGYYTTVLGCRVSSLENIPAGFMGVTIPQSAYRKYKAIGNIPDSVASVWSNIWQSGPTINRTYTADFDVYGEKSQLGDQSEVDVFISVG